MEKYQEIAINTPSIKLDQFLKWAAIAATGGEAKILISSGQIKVNNKIEMQKGKKLLNGDIVEVKKEKYQVVFKS
ncbi:RNA-binding S4 domain-containing protein [Bacillota bacterium LX-D]|nr:RNA-binding S4 domain-containing protein [Bacillota bacterium LX-D]